MGTDEQAIIDILSRRNLPHLRAVFEQYAKLEDVDLEKALSRELSFNFKKACITIGLSAKLFRRLVSA